MSTLGRVLVITFILFITPLELNGKSLRRYSRKSKDKENTYKYQIEIDESDIEDPETTPGLYQGDIAIDTALHSYLRVGLQWDVFQRRKWPNRTIPYVISPLYDPEDKVGPLLF